jgi:DNA-binding GntR family transcriptional regulator
MVNSLEVETYSPLSEIVYRNIRSSIIRGELLQGATITEVELANRLRVSKTPVREALRRLSQEGLIVTAPHRGATVASLTAGDLEEIYLMRSRLESLAARIAAERLTAEDAKELEAIVDELRCQTVRGDKEKIHRLNVTLHELIWRISRTRRLSQMLSNLQGYIEMSRSALLLTPRGAEVLLEEHSGIVQAILERDPDRAEQAMIQHIAHIITELRSRRGPEG